MGEISTLLATTMHDERLVRDRTDAAADHRRTLRRLRRRLARRRHRAT